MQLRPIARLGPCQVPIRFDRASLGLRYPAIRRGTVTVGPVAYLATFCKKGPPHHSFLKYLWCIAGYIIERANTNH